MYSSSNNYFKRIECEPWGSLAYLAGSFKIPIKENGHESKKLKRKIKIIKYILQEELRRQEENKGNFSSAFLVAMFKTVRNIESSFEKAGVMDKTFIYFLKALLHKAKKEKLVVIKPMERALEFEKIKKISERDDYLRLANKS